MPAQPPGWRARDRCGGDRTALQRTYFSTASAGTRTDLGSAGTTPRATRCFLGGTRSRHRPGARAPAARGGLWGNWSAALRAAGPTYDPGAGPGARGHVAYAGAGRGAP